MKKSLTYTLILLLLCLSQWTFAQSLRTVMPKNKQTVSHDVKIEWSNLNQEVEAYQLQLSSNSQLILDTILYKKTLEIKLPIGEYEWNVYVLKNQIFIDSASSSFSVYTPYEIDSLNLWLTPDTNYIIQRANNGVVQWLDKSKQQNHSMTTSSAAQPLYSSNGLNGYGTVGFNNTALYYNRIDLTNALTTKNYSIFMLYNYNTSSSGKMLLGSISNSLWGMGVAANRYIIRDNVNITGVGIQRDKFAIHNMNAKNDSVYQYINGIEFGKDQSVYIPGGDFRLGYTEKPNSEILEVIMINDSISLEERDKIDHYLMDKYAPPINLGADRMLCSFPAFIHTNIDYAVKYEWSTGDSAASIQVDSSGIYYLTITDVFNRQSTDSIYIGVDTFNYQVKLPYDSITICLGDTIEVGGVSFEHYTYSWSTFQNTPHIKVADAGQYVLLLRNCLNRISFDTVEVIVNHPEFSLGADTIGCFNKVLKIEADSNFTNVSYLWSNGLNTPFIEADSSQIYSLKVTDTYGCYYVDSIGVQIDSTLYGLTLGADTSLCAGNLIGLKYNPDTIQSYLWNTNDSSKTLAIHQAGDYHLTVSNGRCTVSDSIYVGIQGMAPQVSFTAQDVCYLDFVSFTDFSQAPAGDTIISWSWDFDGLGSSSLQHPTFYFDSAGHYLVVLTVETDKGCLDTAQRLIKVHPLPESDFTSFEKCEKSAVHFVNNSSIPTGNIIGYLWNFGDTLAAINSSNQPNPSHIFDTLGVYNISLISTSDIGCRDTITKSIKIEATPNVDFIFEGNCLNDSTSFTNKTTLSQGQIKEMFWLIDGQTITKTHPRVKYNMIGEHTVILAVLSDSSCGASMSKTVDIHQVPKADFIINALCEDEAIEIEDNSRSSIPIVNWRYIFNSRDTSYQQNPVFENQIPGHYPLALLVEDVNSCKDSVLKPVKVNIKPKADFLLKGNGSGVPYQLAVENLSKDAATYLWEFGEEDNSSTAKIPQYTYEEAGNYKLRLITSTVDNCSDTINQELRLTPYYLDAELKRLILQKDAHDRLNLQLEIANTGNNVIEKMEVATNVNNGVSFIETLEGPIYKSQTMGYQLQSNLQLKDQMDFVCVRLISVNDTLDEVISNNKDCQAIPTIEELYLSFYPNPTMGNINIEYILPMGGDFSLRIYDAIGKEIYHMDKKSQQRGYYISLLPTEELKAGMYYYSFQFKDQKKSGTFIKQ